MLNNIFLVATPFQVICALNYLRKKNVDGPILFIIGEESYNTFLSLRGDSLDLTYFIKPEWIPKIWYFVAIRILLKKNSRVYVGDIRSLYMNIVMQSERVAEIVALDDGSGSIAILNSDGDIAINIRKVSGYKRVICEFLKINFKKINLDKVIFASVFKANGLRKNAYYIGLGLFDGVKFRESISIFLGGVYVSLGVLSEEEYLHAIKKAMEIDNTLVYVPHRRESKEMTLKVKRYIPHIQVLNMDTCIEVYLFENLIQPNNVFSIYSTALVTLEPIALGSCYYFEVDTRNLEFRYKKGTELLYGYLRDNNFTDFG